MEGGDKNLMDQQCRAIDWGSVGVVRECVTGVG